MSELELQLLAALRNFRRLNNQTVVNVFDAARAHIEADRLLAVQPELDDRRERYDAPHRVEHRAFVNRMFRRDEF
jgi:hypothetical protein